MSQEPGTAPATAELDRLLLDAKLSAPRPRPGSVSRAALIERARSSGCRVVGVTAPAGYGKSTLLAEWALGDDRQVAWVLLDRLDDDPVALLTLLASAVARIPGRDPDLARDMAGLGLFVLGRAAPRLAAALRASPEPFVLFLDDLHEVRSPACHDVLGVVLAGVPAGSQVVAASRAEQPHLPRLRVSGDAIELVAGDLALDASAVERIFAASHVPVTRAVAAVVAERTEGWPVGIYLASLVARDGADGAHDPAVVTGDDRYVADYLHREALRQLPEDTRRFLRRTAVLDQLGAPLCDAVLGGPRGAGESGEHSAAEQLRRLEASSMFLVPLDRRRVWFRYHPLFREFLLGELARVEPEVTPDLHARAADWYEAHGSPARALEHLLSAGERERGARLVARLALLTYQSGQVATVRRWLGALGDTTIARYPPLAVLAGYVAARTGHAVEAERWAATADAATFDGAPIDGTASFDSARAMLRALMCSAGPDRMLADARAALRQEPEWSRWRDTALVLCGEAHLLRGEEAEAARVLTEATELAAGNGNVDTVVFGESELALLDMAAGRWAQAAERVRHVVGQIDSRRMHDYPTSVLAFTAAAHLALHLGERDEAVRRLRRAMRGRALCTQAFPFVAVRVRVHLARTCEAMGDHGAARHLLREIDDVLLRRPDLGLLLDEVATLRGTLDADGRVGASGAPPLTPAELRLLPYLQTYLTIREIGERLFVSRNTASSQISSIYRKLGASSRGDAVRRAVALGLLGQ